MDVSALAAIESIKATDSTQLMQQNQMRSPIEQVQFAQLDVSNSKPTQAGGAYADLSSKPVADGSAQGDWIKLTDSVVNGTSQGLLKPRIQELEKALVKSKDSPGAVSSEQISLLMIKVGQASAVSNMLSTSVNAIRRSIATLIEKTG